MACIDSVLLEEMQHDDYFSLVTEDFEMVDLFIDENDLERYKEDTLDKGGEY